MFIKRESRTGKAYTYRLLPSFKTPDNCILKNFKIWQNNQLIFTSSSLFYFRRFDDERITNYKWRKSEYILSSDNTPTSQKYFDKAFPNEKF